MGDPITLRDFGIPELIRAEEIETERLASNHQFDEKTVPENLKILLRPSMACQYKRISLEPAPSKPFESKGYLLKLSHPYAGYNRDIRFEKQDGVWTVTYEKFNKTIKIEDLEKSIIDHLSFMLSSDPHIELEELRITICGKDEFRRKLNTLLPLMFDLIDHQIHIEIIYFVFLEEDTLLSLLKHLKPGTLKEINFHIGWKEDGNYENLDDIAGTEQWKQAKTINSHGEGVFKLADFSHCQTFYAIIDRITPEEASDARERFFNSENNKKWNMYFKEKLDMDPFKTVLSSILNGTNPIIDEINGSFTFYFEFPNDRLEINLHNTFCHIICFERVD